MCAHPSHARVDRALLAARVRRLRRLPLEHLVAVAGPLLRLVHAGELRRRVFTSVATFWLFLSQVLGPARVCREAVRNAQAWLTQTDLSPSTSAYCQARARLPQQILDEAFASLGHQLRHNSDGPWMQRPVNVVDGTGLSMPDTPQNQSRYPQSWRQRPGCGFPTMRLVAMFSLATGAIVGVASGPLRVDERTLWRRLWPLMEGGSVVLADRGFCGFADYCRLLERGIDAVMRLNARRGAGVRPLARLAPGDQLVEWKKTGVGPKWMTKNQWRALPDVLRVRHIRVRVAVGGFRTRVLTLATTILDAKTYPAQCFAALYRRRWMAELFLRDIKITMGMDILRCKTPALVHKELTMHLIAYNLVRALMLQAAGRDHANPVRLSLAGTLATVRQWAPALAAQRSRNARRRLLEQFWRCLARDTIPWRPNRLEPRARKRRAKNYQLLNKPRAQFKEIQHRNKYTRPLS
jgi:hypothetical protein